MKHAEVKIIISGNRSRLEGEFPISVVKEATSYPLKNAYFIKAAWAKDGRYHFFRRPNNTFPTGLIPFIEDALEEWVEEDSSRTLKVSTIDNRKKPKINGNTFELDDVELYDYQLEAATACLEYERGVLKMATNAGKTYMFAAVLKRLGVSALIIVPGKDLLYQTSKVFADLLKTEIGLIGDGHWKPKKITVAIPATLGRRLKPNLKKKSGKDKTRLLIRKRECQKFLKSRDILCIDEGHLGPQKTIMNIARACTAYYRYAMSGTPFDRLDGNDMKLIAQTGPVIYEVSNEDLIDRDLSTTCEVQFIPIEAPKLVVGTEYADVYEYGIVKNDVRNKAIVDKVLEFTKEGRNCLIGVRRIEHGETLQRMLQEFFPDVQFIRGDVDSEDRVQAMEDFKANRIPVIISSVWGQGISIDTIDAGINASGGKGKIGVLQGLGRLLRKGGNFKHTIMVDFADHTHKYLTKHSLQRLKIYRAEKCFKVKWG
jgi:superfamily II DNA or RNA helicase